MHLKQAELQRLFDSNDQESQRAALSREESRVGLGVLMIGLWCQKVRQNLASLGAGEAVDLASSSSAAAVSQPSSSPICMASQSTAKSSHASAEAPPLAAGSWADHMSVTASDAEEEEEAACIQDDVSMVPSILG